MKSKILLGTTVLFACSTVALCAKLCRTERELDAQHIATSTATTQEKVDWCEPTEFLLKVCEADKRGVKP